MVSCCALLLPCVCEYQRYADTVLLSTLSQWIFVTGLVGKSFANVANS